MSTNVEREADRAENIIRALEMYGQGYNTLEIADAIKAPEFSVQAWIAMAEGYLELLQEMNSKE